MNTRHGDDWTAATFDGLTAVQRRSVAGSRPADRLAWLEQALQLAQASGALARALSARQRACDRLWSADVDSAT